MVYGLIFLVVGVVVFLLRRRLGIPLLVVIFSAFVIGWWSSTIAGWLLSLGVGKSSAWLQALVETVVILLVAILAIHKSNPTGRSQSGRIIEAILFALTMIVLLNGSIGYWFGLDITSLNIKVFLASNYQILLTGVGLYALYELLFRAE